jgi:hypothetical protein
VARRSGSGPNLSEIEQARIGMDGEWFEMADWRNTADGKACDAADGVGIGTVERIANQCGGAGEVDLIATGSEKEMQATRRLALKDDRLDDLIERTSRSGGGLFGGARFGPHLERGDRKTCGGQGSGDTVEALAHLLPLGVSARGVDHAARPGHCRDHDDRRPDDPLS